jgi:hypothetical protein
MSENKHTPGPWEVTSVSQNTGNVSIGHRDLRIVIAEVTNAASFGDMLSGAMARGGGAFAQDDCHTQFANARLIAAAPELLDALRETWRVLDAAGLLNLRNGVQLGQTSWYIKASDAKASSEAAIAKAEGTAIASQTPSKGEV